MTLADGKPAFEAYYESRQESYREDVLERVRSLDEEVKAYKEAMRKTED